VFTLGHELKRVFKLHYGNDDKRDILKEKFEFGLVQTWLYLIGAGIFCTPRHSGSRV